jgi:tRNA pseudouridine13 synthase
MINIMSENLVLDPPLVTADLPGIGGTIKIEPEDFDVEEIPAYQPSGSGDFLNLWIEKRDMGAEYFTRQVAKRLNVSPGEIGTAGLKDRRAVTRQWVSAPASAEANLPKLDGDGIRVLQVSRHTNKLRPGHLHGNRFRVLVRSAGDSPAQPVQASRPHYEGIAAIVERLRQHGLPNFYGAQRFGRDGETLQIGFALLRGETPERKVRNPFLKKLALSAAQSALFNHYLGQRLQDGLLRRVLPGDVMAKIPFGGMFVAEDVAREQQRFDSRETITAGPIVGRKTFPAKDEAAEREAATLAAFDLTTAQFAGFGKLLQGTRRHNLVYVEDLAWEETPDGMRFTFTLPAGSYATILLRELMKNDVSDAEDSSAE